LLKKEEPSKTMIAGHFPIVLGIASLTGEGGVPFHSGGTRKRLDFREVQACVDPLVANAGEMEIYIRVSVVPLAELSELEPLFTSDVVSIHPAQTVVVPNMVTVSVPNVLVRTRSRLYAAAYTKRNGIEEQVSKRYSFTIYRRT